jgi:hypothetical protein
MHVPFKIHYRNNLIDKKDSYLISRPPSWDDRNYSYGHQLYPSEVVSEEKFYFVPTAYYTLLPQHIILFPQYIILFPQHITLFPQYIIILNFF